MLKLSGGKVLGIPESGPQRHQAMNNGNYYSVRNKSSNIQRLLKKSVEGLQSFEFDDDYDLLEELILVKKIDKMFKPPKR